jgi:hypothetical protein
MLRRSAARSDSGYRSLATIPSSPMIHACRKTTARVTRATRLAGASILPRLVAFPLPFLFSRWGIEFASALGRTSRAHNCSISRDNTIRVCQEQQQHPLIFGDGCQLRPVDCDVMHVHSVNQSFVVSSAREGAPLA